MWERADVRTFGVCLQQSSSKVTRSYTWNLTFRRFSVNEIQPVSLFGYKYQLCLQTVGSLIWGEGHPLNKDSLSRLCSSRARWSLAPNFCSCVNRKSHIFFIQIICWEKLREGRGVTREERGLPLSCPSTDYRRLVNMYKFHILKSFYNTEKICNNMCLYIPIQSLNK